MSNNISNTSNALYILILKNHVQNMMILKILKHFAKYIYYKQTHTQIFKKQENL